MGQVMQFNTGASIIRSRILATPATIASEDKGESLLLSFRTLHAPT